MRKTSVLVCAVLGLGLGAWAGSKSYDINLYQKISAGGVDLQPGACQLEVDRDKATFHQGKIAASSPVKVEAADRKYLRTTMVLVQSDGKMHVQEIHLADTKTKLVFTETQP